MADTTALKNRIRAAIKANDNQEITGPVLQQALLDMVDELNGATETEASQRQNGDSTLQQAINSEAQTRQSGDTALGQRITEESQQRQDADTTLQGLINGIKQNIDNGYVYAGIATPSSTPATGKVFYLALTAGTYTNFGSTVVSQGINILKYNGSAWSLDAFIGIDDIPTLSSTGIPKSGGTFDFVMKNGSAFDISAHFASGGTLATYADLSAALAALDTLPAAYKRGGMVIRYVDSSDNKYVQARCMAQNFTTDVTQWQGVDDEIISGSKNLIEGNAVFKELYNTNFSELELSNNRRGYVKQSTGEIGNPESNTWRLYYFTCSKGDRFKVKYTSWDSTAAAVYSVFNSNTIEDSSIASMIGPHGESDIEYDVVIADSNAKWFVVQERNSSSTQRFQMGCSVKKAINTNKIIQQMFNSKDWIVNGNVAYDSNEIPVSCDIKWADGTLGTLVYSDFNDNVFEYATLTATYNTQTIVYTLTFDENGYTTNETINIQ